ncbi:MAG: 3-phenylpropionate/trans-cinnamate dioxygenase ferredoxin component [Actinomycetota bacterium]|nr:3-phenylpropionate/trans-cinnamate dioxygenase ferredoxin component [Actinomycetota bacterium]
MTTTTNDYKPIAKLDEIPDCGMKQVVVNGEVLGLYRVGNEVFAISDICTHEETYLTGGEFDCDEMEVECPLHGSKFDVRTGAVRILPATKPVATYPVKIEGDLVLVGPRNE